jgi:hypothetical protein
MRPFTRTIIELFDGKRRYLIPLYQRQYAWRVTPQLELLWEDIERVSTRLLQSGQLPAPHFMGAIVISQIKTYGKEVQAFEVIDGQQRLTTFQLLLTALRDVAASVMPDYAQEVSTYLFNDGVMAHPSVERFKLWPSLVDRPVFTAIVDPALTGQISSQTPTDEVGVVRQAVAAHEYFRRKIHSHVHVGDEFDPFRLEKLFEALRSGLAVVSIELEGGDEAQTIFETLNSRGVDLTAGDLLRNFIFQRAKGMGQSDGSLNIDALYEKYWLPLDRWYWRIGETRGRLTKPRLDWMLTDYLTMQRAELFAADSLFDTYRKWILEKAPFPTVEAELNAIQRIAEVARRIAEPAEKDPLGQFGKFSRAFDMSTAMPLVLYLATEAGLGDDLAAALQLIESYIIRRDICGLPTGNYNRFFVEMIGRLRESGSPTLDGLRQALSTSNAEAIRFPDDAEWRQGWMGSDQYKPARQPKLRYLFEGLEHKKRAQDGEIVAIKSDLTLEHIMPRKWRTHWPVPGFEHVAADDVDINQMMRQDEREAVINKLGNLTLLTHKLNASISNGDYATKMPAVRAHAALTLNRELHAYDHWDEETIAKRGLDLFHTAATIWPAPAVLPVSASEAH